MLLSHILKTNIMTSVAFPHISLYWDGALSLTSLKTGIRLNCLVPWLMMTWLLAVVRTPAGVTFTRFSRIVADLKQLLPAASKHTIAVSLYLSAQRQF